MVNILEYYDDFCLESGASIYLWNVDGRSLEPAFPYTSLNFKRNMKQRSQNSWRKRIISDVVHRNLH